jgi:diguanylate cyclase (GGDEF)-like protein
MSGPYPEGLYLGRERAVDARGTDFGVLDRCTRFRNRKMGRLCSRVVEEQTLEAQEKSRLFGSVSWYRRRADALEQQTGVDELTGLRNQRALWHELTRRSDACSPARPLAVLMLDFDLFGRLNESYGRDISDAVLRRGASVLRSTATSPRLVFRVGGAEFVVLAELGGDEATKLAARICSTIGAQNGALPSVTVSCGVATLEGPVEPWIALDRADAAKRDAKRSGGDRVAVAGSTSPGERAMLIEELEQETARRAALALAVATLEVRDKRTADHSEDVLSLCEAVGRRLELDDLALSQLVAGGQLHDVGKVAIPSSILEKPSALTDAEWAVIREHTVIGEQILRSVPEMAAVATVVRHSHEHWDGSGYPDGLSGEEIPLASRVILCADAFHAMRCDRPYRRGRPAHEALAEIRSCAGTQFDPFIVDAFVAVAADARKGTVVGIDGLRKKRLVVLLSALVIGTTGVAAGVPEVRDAIRSVFGATTTPSHASEETTDPQDFGFGPLGDLLRLPPAEHHKHAPGHRAQGPKPTADDGKRRHASKRNRATFSSPGGGGGQVGDDGLRGTPGPGPIGTGPTSGEPPAGEAPSGDGPVSEAPTRQAPTTTQGNGHGHALGRSAPVPRQPAQPPSGGGRTDPPALGHQLSSANGKAKGHFK